MLEQRIKIGVIGAGSFGTAITSLLALNNEVLLFSRQQTVVEEINSKGEHLGIHFPATVKATKSHKEIAEQCKLIFPIVASKNFRQMMLDFKSYLTPQHILIHGTKGFDVQSGLTNKLGLAQDQIFTMSQVILQESNVLRVGCLSGPNLAAEILEGQPTATVVASAYDEVIELGKKVLTSSKFYAYGSHDIRGAELAGALKNVVAIASGMLKGMGLGKNIQAVLITRGLEEMITFGKAMEADPDSFYSVAGVGDLIATTTSRKSRNYSFGFRFGQGESTAAILSDSSEPVEGLRTIEICKQLAVHYTLKVPVFDTLYKVIVENEDKSKAIEALVKSGGE